MAKFINLRRWYAALVVTTLVALAAVLIAIAAGASPRHLWPVAGFLALAAGSDGYRRMARRALKRRTFHQRQSPVPRGVRLTTPFWIRLEGSSMIMGLAAVISAMVAALGFPQVAFGILLVLGVLACVPVVSVFGVSALTFEEAGLRVHHHAAHCLIPWESIRVVDPLGPEGFQVLRLVIADLDGIRDSVSPDTPRNRRLAQSMLGTSGNEILLMPWTGGLDWQVLDRAIRGGIAGAPDRIN